ncbi:MAG: nucleotidyltransferase family protein [Rubrivivax sp.]
MTPSARQALLLDLLSPQVPAAPALAAAGGEDWQALLAMARTHRVGPLLNRRLADAALRVPAPVRQALATEHRRHAMRSLLWQRDLLQAHQALVAADVEHCVLKGPLLALGAYADPALRPLRDLDLLVPRAEALRAWHALVAAGCTPQKSAGDPRAALQSGAKHLPPLHAATGGFAIELHVALTDDEHRPAGAPDPAEDPAFWARRRPFALAGHALPGCGPTDLLFHLAGHAVYGHAFDNGPLLLADVERLLATQAIDWPLFWQQAQRLGMARGCALVLAMAAPASPSIDWPAGVAPPDAAVCADLRLLMLREQALRSEARLHAALQGRPLRERFSVLLRRARAIRPARWPAAAQKLVRILRLQRQDPLFADDSARLVRLQRWLHEG